jgi:GTP-binding protein
MLSATRGTAIIDSVFDSYRPKIPEEILSRDKGSLLAFADGKATTFGIEGAQDRGKMFIKPQDDVYKGMVSSFRTIDCMENSENNFVTW